MVFPIVFKLMKSQLMNVLLYKLSSELRRAF